eukprot:47538_1
MMNMFGLFIEYVLNTVDDIPASEGRSLKNPSLATDDFIPPSDEPVCLDDNLGTSSFGLLDKFIRACVSSWDVFLLWFGIFLDLLKHLAGFIQWTYRETKPFFRAYVYPLIDYQLTALYNTSLFTKILMVLCIVVIILVWLANREIRRRRYVERSYQWYSAKRKRLRNEYKTIMKQVDETSHMLAVFLPHLGMAFVALCLIFIFPGLMHSIATSWVPTMLGLMYPLVSSVRSVRDKVILRVHHWLEFWVVLLSWTFIVNATPLGFFLDRFWFSAELQLLVLLWMLLPMTSGSHLTYGLLTNLVSRWSAAANRRKLASDGSDQPAVVGNQAAVGQVTSLLSRLTSMPGQYLGGVFTLLGQGGIPIIVSCLFVFSSGMMTRMGCLLIGVAYPVYCIIVERSNPGLMRWLKYVVVYVICGFIVLHME